MRLKRCLSVVLSAAMVMTGVSPSVAATVEPGAVNEALDIGTDYGNDQDGMTYAETTEILTDVFGALPDNDELFAAYVDGLFLGDPSVSLYGEYGKEKLEGID